MSTTTLRRARSRAIALIRNSASLYIGTHVRPDGDALGSLLALALALEAGGRRVAALCADPAPEPYRFLPGVGRLCADPPPWRADLGLVVDCDGPGRLGRLEAAFVSLPALVDIDHHATDHAFGDVRLVDATAAASGELVYDLVRALGAQITSEVATCLYTALLTDTGRFTYGNTTARALRIASELARAGADPHGIARALYEQRSMAATHLLGVALSRLSAELDHEVVSSMLRLADFRDTGAGPADTEGIIDHLRAIGGPRVALLFVELPEGGVRVSLRSDGSADVSRIALSFGGGGHAMAAGCTLPEGLEQARARVLAAVAAALPDHAQ